MIIAIANDVEQTFRSWCLNIATNMRVKTPFNTKINKTVNMKTHFVRKYAE